MRRQWFASLVLVTIGCAGAVDSGGPSEQELKLAAAKARSSGNAASDACAEHSWYGDGVCDTFCANTDKADCVPNGSGDAVVCAEFIEQADGACSRPATDVCRFQDPDCTTPGGGGGSDPSGPVACALISELPDGRCGRPVSDPCRFQDPDCNAGAGSGGSSGSGSGTAGAGGSAGSAGGSPSGGSSAGGSGPGASGGSTGAGTVDCDVNKVTCQTLIEVVCPDGQVPSVVNQCYGPCVPQAECEPVACLTYIEDADGTCSRPRYDPCRNQDPDCTKQ